GAGAAGPGLAGAALPHPHAYLAGTENFHELGIDAIGKERMMLEARAEFFQIQTIGIVGVEHAMGIAHRDAGDAVDRAVDLERIIENLAVGVDGDLAPFEDRLAHIDLDEVVADDARADDAGQRLDGELSLFREAVVAHIFCEAADAVAAHFDLSAVGVVDFHLEIDGARRMDREQLVRADAETPVAELLGDFSEIALFAA